MSELPRLTVMEWYPGTPSEDGGYLVWLAPNAIDGIWFWKGSSWLTPDGWLNADDVPGLYYTRIPDKPEFLPEPSAPRIQTKKSFPLSPNVSPSSLSPWNYGPLQEALDDVHNRPWAVSQWQKDEFDEEVFKKLHMSNWESQPMVWNEAMLGPQPESIDHGSVTNGVRDEPSDEGPWDSLIRWYGLYVVSAAADRLYMGMGIMKWSKLADHVKVQELEDEIKRWRKK